MIPWQTTDCGVNRAPQNRYFFPPSRVFVINIRLDGDAGVHDADPLPPAINVTGTPRPDKNPNGLTN
jgi:hypothetical protein